MILTSTLTAHGTRISGMNDEQRRNLARTCEAIKYVAVSRKDQIGT